MGSLNALSRRRERLNITVQTFESMRTPSPDRGVPCHNHQSAVKLLTYASVDIVTDLHFKY
jgi:hypothetical protein